MTTKPKAKKFRIRRTSPGDDNKTPSQSSAPSPSLAARAASQAASRAAAQAASQVAPQVRSQAPPRSSTQAVSQAPPAASQAEPRVAPQIAPQVTPQAALQAASAAAPHAAIPTPGPAPEKRLSPELEIDAIKREGLTGRQLRMARRVAQKNGIAATSDYDAIRLLRDSGIDPFQRANMLELISPGGDIPTPTPSDSPVQLPQTVPLEKTQLPSTEMASPAERRIREISEIQRDIARRRRRKLALLVARLAIFVFLPTIFAGWYFYVVATPMYATKSSFLVQQADGAASSGLGALLPSQMNSNQDAIAVQDFLTSKDAMIRLDKDVGFKSHFASPIIDPIQRLELDSSNEQAYKLYKKYVKIGYDPTEGAIRMEVIAADPQISAGFAKALVQYAEQRVDDLSRRKRGDQLRDARESLDKAKAERRAAQETLVQLQEGTFLDPEGLITSLRTQISSVQVQLQDKELQLQALLDNSRPNRARVEGVEGDVRRLQNLLDSLERKMTEEVSGEASLAQKTSQIQMAQADLATADLLMQSSLQTLKQTELEANRQVRYLTTSVDPVASEDPSYPRSFENTVLAFFIFSGIYLMISLTASILREQVSS